MKSEYDIGDIRIAEITNYPHESASTYDGRALVVMNVVPKTLDPAGSGVVWLIGEPKDFTAGQLVVFKLVGFVDEDLNNTIWELVTK